MRLILKLITAPFILLLTLLILFLSFIVNLSSILLGIVAVILFLLGMFALFTTGFANGIAILILAWLVSPYGLPMLAAWIIGCLQSVKHGLKSIAGW